MKISEELLNSKFGKGLSRCGNENFNSYFTNGEKKQIVLVISLVGDE